MNQEAIDLLIQSTPRLKRYRAKLETMQPGTFCVHRAWGMGQIKSYDAQDNKLIIDFEEGREGHPMDPEFCIEKLDILGDDDILVASRKEPERIQEMIKKQPGDVIVEILGSFPGNIASNTELENILSRLIGPAKYKKWWTATKKALAKDPRIGVPAKKTEPYVLRDEPIKPEDEILEEFFETKAPKKKILHANKLVEMSVKHEDIKEALPAILSELTASLAETKQLNPGERLYGIWIRNDLARFIHTDVELLEPTSYSIIKDHTHLCELADQIPATHYKRLIDLTFRTFTEDWDRHVFEFLKNSSGKFTAECVNFLLDKEFEADITKTFQRWLVEQNLKGPVLTWILKNRNSRKYSRMLHPIVTPRLLSAIFWAIDNEALQTAGTRRIPLADQLLEDPELIAELLSTATPETAHDLAQTLILNQGFEDLSKKSLLARFIKIFPSIQALVAGGAPETRSDEDVLFVSAHSFSDRKREYDELVTVKIPKNKLDIAEARAHGDLKENAEYKMSRQEQDILLSRKSELERDINRAQVTDFKDAPSENVGIGSVIELEQSTGQIQTFSILGAWDSIPEKNILSYQTPLARALTGKKAGETVSIEIDGHHQDWTIKSIARWIDKQ
mgnify:CR=1 FL=1